MLANCAKVNTFQVAKYSTLWTVGRPDAGVFSKIPKMEKPS